MIYPVFPKPDDIIGIFAPSAGVGRKLESFDLSLDAIKSCGYKIKETDSVRIDSIRAFSGRISADEYHSLLADNDVRAIVSAAGGEFCMEILPHLDEVLIKNNVKWLCGYSDPTNIEFYLTTKLDIATMYGFNAGGLDWRPLHEFQKNHLSFLSGNLVTQHSYDLYDSDRSYNKIEFNLDTPVSWDIYYDGNNEPSDMKLDVSGRIIGGCTDVIRCLIGTPYGDCSDFLDKYADDGFIWYFDTYEMPPLELYRVMLQFKFAGWFKNAKAIIFGRVMYPGDETDDRYTNLLVKAIPEIPFIWGADIGHTKPCMTLINGSIGHLNCYNGKAEINMELK